MVPLYQSTEDVVKSEIATFFDVFPHGTIWSNQYASGGGYDVVMLARPEPLRIDPAALQERLDRPDHARIAAALNEVEFTGATGLLATYAGQAADLRPWLADAQINTDRNLRLEYLAGMANNVYDAGIYQHILEYRRFPEEMFVEPAEWGRGTAALAAAGCPGAVAKSTNDMRDSVPLSSHPWWAQGTIASSRNISTGPEP